ncbi:putative maintenance of mitochondrial morphology protein 1 [Lyophyllum shimeji]|uniref:Maintenance of mitochondrial morphology protein 1 n=1 Tax=Lyophyllum shimeji TaxID=47721 RepID=A0A9P3UPK4_LYOSH|nr:putative maintenance of mitochondrial morphology protein 1 [Lyophyllum shimeji]
MLSKTPTSSSSRPSSPTSTAHKWLYPIRRVFPFTGAKPQSPIALSVVTSYTGSNSKSRHLNRNGTTAPNRPVARDMYAYMEHSGQVVGMGGVWALGNGVAGIGEFMSRSPLVTELAKSQASSANAERPSFIGPVPVTSVDFSSTSPDVELVDLRDICRDFLEDDDDDDLDRDCGPVKVTEGADPDEEGFEWVPRRAAVVRDEGQGLAYHHLPLHVRHGYGAYGSASMYAVLTTPIDPWNLPGLADHKVPLYSGPVYPRPSPATPFHAPSLNDIDAVHTTTDMPPPPKSSPSQAHTSPSQQPLPQSPPQPQPQAPHPKLQIHLHVNWHPTCASRSPRLVFTGELAVAYEGERRRVHICVLDDQDPYGLYHVGASDRPKRDSVTTASGGSSGTPPEPEDDEYVGMGVSAGVGAGVDVGAGVNVGAGAGAGTPMPPPISISMSSSQAKRKRVPVGQRLLPTIYIESEIGQADKHVLKNVTRVERFIQESGSYLLKLEA